VQSPKGGTEFTTVSDILSQTNQVLFSEEGDLDISSLFVDDIDNTGVDPNTDIVTESVPPSSPSHSSSNSMATGTSADLSGGPTNADIMACLRDINGKIGNIDSKMESMENRLKSLESLEKKVDGFEGEMKKLWTYIHDSSKKTNDKLDTVTDKVESTDFSLGLLNDKVVQLEKEKDSLRNEVVYLKSQSMRNNLIFVNIPESSPEATENCEELVKTFILEKLNVANELVDKIVFDRAHRMGPGAKGTCRKIVTRFRDFKDREFVRKQWKTLEGTDFAVHEQFPPEVVEKRKKLYPKMKKARDQEKRAWTAYDTLYIDGKPVRD